MKGQAIFLTISHITTTQIHDLYQDYINELKKYYRFILVVAPIERREKGQTYLVREGHVTILRVKIPNITKTHKIEKMMSTLLISKLYARAIKQYFPNERFDLITYATPPITLAPLITKLKQQSGGQTALLLKDIFPQNAVDLNMFKQGSLLEKFFSRKEQETYQVSDYIGVMSEANRQYLLTHHDIPSHKVHLFRNAMFDTSHRVEANRETLFQQYKLAPHKVTFIYGGNIGEPQGPENIKAVMSRFQYFKDAQLVIIGSGTQFLNIKAHARHLPNVKVLAQLPQAEYHALLKACDVGLIFLDTCFTIPNYPSRLTNYLMLGKPIIAFTDAHSDIGEDVVNHQCGFWINDGDIQQCMTYIKKLTRHAELRIAMGQRARQFFETSFTIEDNVKHMMTQLGVKPGNHSTV